MQYLDRTRILQADEIRRCVAELKGRQLRSKTAAGNLAIFRLSCCCGLRRKEIAGLRIDDVVIGGPRPFILVRTDNTKGQEGKRRKRKVPLWWDAQTRLDLEAWLERRRQLPGDRFVCSERRGFVGQGLAIKTVGERWETAIRVLGEARVRQLSIHSGRHSFCSHSLAAGRSLGEVREAAGHANIATTNIYIHALDTEGCRDVFQ